jgi:hypothetical protein
MKELVRILSCLVYVQLLVDGKQILRSVTAASEMKAATMSRIEDEGTTLLDMAIAIPKLSTLTGKIEISYISTTLIPVNLNANL